MSLRRWWCRPDLPNRNRRGPLRIAFLLTSMPVGGAETLLVNLMDRIDPRLYRCEIICLKEPGPLGETIASRVPLHSGLLRGKWDLRVLLRLFKLLRRRHIDAVITVGAGDKMFWGRLAAWLAGAPVIGAALHSTGWPDGVGRLNRMLTPMTDAFIAVADSHGAFMKQVERFPASKVHVIRNGVDTERFRALPEAAPLLREELRLAATCPLVGIVAALRPEKNHRMFLDVAQRIAKDLPDAHFVIVGEGPQRPSIEQACQELRLSDRVHLLGNRDDTERILAALDLFLLTSDNEASPVSILEALACQIPVISTDVGSVRESVVAGTTGQLVSPGDASAMAAHAVRLLGDPQQRREMGRAGRQRVIAAGSLAAMVDGYERLIAAAYDAAVRQSSPATTPRLAKRLRKELS